MYKTNGKDTQLPERLTANTDTLATLLDCGRATAVKVGEAAGARIKIGKRVLWNISRVNAYLDAERSNLNEE